MCRLLLLVTVRCGGSMLEAMSAESATVSVGVRYANLMLRTDYFGKTRLALHVPSCTALILSFLKICTGCANCSTVINRDWASCNCPSLLILQVPLSAIGRRRKARLEYNRLYTRTHCKLSNYKDPYRYVCARLPCLAQMLWLLL